MADQQLDEIAIEKFREYLRIDTTTAHADYYAVGDFLRKYAAELGATFSQHELVKGKPIYILTFEGRDSAAKARKSVILNSHMDVVPAYPESWSHPPFAADMTDDGRIIARGSQDMKCVGIWYLEAIRRLKASGNGALFPSRTIHCMFVPDEEVGGEDGMKEFVKTPEFQALNANFGLDEGMANLDQHSKAVVLFHSERYPLWTKITFEGTTGHASQFLPDTVGEKLQKFLTMIYAHREQQQNRIGKDELDRETGETTRVGEADVQCLNLTALNGGIANNVVPSNIDIVIDCRMPPDTPPEEGCAMFDRWCAEASGSTPGSVCRHLLKPVVAVPKEYRRIPRSSAYCAAVEKACVSSGYTFEWQTFPGATDSRFLRATRIKTISVSPLVGVPRLLHCHDEYVTRDVFIKGVHFYVNLLPAVADIQED